MQDAGLWGYGAIYRSHRLGIMRSRSTLPTHLFSLACFLCWKGMCVSATGPSSFQGTLRCRCSWRELGSMLKPEVGGWKESGR